MITLIFHRGKQINYLIYIYRINLPLASFDKDHVRGTLSSCRT